MKKKSQLEIMGLAVIVILISLIILFVVRFVVLKEPSQVRKEYTEFDVSYSFINTLVNTNIPNCSDVSFKELFQDCALSQIIDCNGNTSCQYIKFELPRILNKTLGIQKINYEFISYIGDNESDQIINPIKGGENCTSYKKAAPQPLSARGQIINLNLYVC